MINDYNQFADAMDLKGGDINKCVDALADLKEMSPEIFNMYDREYRKQKQAKRQIASQTKTKKQEQKAMYMSYDEFEQAFDEMDKVSLMRSDAESPTVKLSKLSRENPALYQEYRQRMHEENERRLKK